MRIWGDIETVNLSTGERLQRVSGDGESRLISQRSHVQEEIRSRREYMARNGPWLPTSTQMQEPHASPKCEPNPRRMTLEEHDRFDR